MKAHRLKKYTGLIIFIAIITLFSCKQSESTREKTQENNNILKNEKIDVSLINLIATPEKYNKKLIRVQGFLNLEFERNALYLHKEDYEVGMEKNSIWIEMSRKDMNKKEFQICNKKYVIIEGIFDMSNRGHMDMFGGTIGQLHRLEIFDNRSR